MKSAAALKSTIHLDGQDVEVLRLKRLAPDAREFVEYLSASGDFVIYSLRGEPVVLWNDIEAYTPFGAEPSAWEV